MCGSAMVLTALPGSLAAAEQDAPIIRTEEDLIRGKENVRTVIEELSELFADDSPAPVVHESKRKISPPYSKVIKSANDRATLIFRPRFTSSKKMFKALDGVITGSTLVEPLDEQNELIINADAKEIESYKEEQAIDRIAATIYVARDSQKGILIGHKGEKLKRVGQAAREDMEQFLGKKDFLQLFVKVNDDWRNNERQLRRFGYESE